VPPTISGLFFDKSREYQRATMGSIDMKLRAGDWVEVKGPL
jgi:hypothetical protein